MGDVLVNQIKMDKLILSMVKDQLVKNNFIYVSLHTTLEKCLKSVYLISFTALASGVTLKA